MRLKIKVNTVFWTAIFGLILTTVYSFVIAQQGQKRKKMLEYLYLRAKREDAEAKKSLG